MKNSKHPFLKWAGIVFLVLGLVYAGLVVAGSMAVRREKAALESAGFPMRPEQVILAAIPEEDNAAPLYNAAVKALKDVPFEGKSVDGDTSSNLFDQLERTAVAVRKDPDNGEVAKNFETLVRDPRVTDFLASVERASALPGYRQENDYSMLAQRMAGQEQDAAKGPEMFLPYISDNLKVSQILAALALQQMSQGNTTAAWRTIEISFRFADTLRDEPLLISQLVRTTQQGIAIKAMKDAAAMSAPSEDVSQALQKQLSLIDGESTAALALNGERILFGEWTFSQSPASLGKFMRKMSPWWEVPFPYFSALTSVVFGPLLQPWENAAFLQASRAMLGGGDKAIPENGSSSSLLRMPGLFAMTKAAVSSAQGLRMNLTHVDSAAVVARLGLAAINYKKEHGAFPRDLQALGAQDLVDPFTGKPLVYRPEPDGFLLYSLGPDATDDNGDKFDHKKQKGDIVWRYAEKAG